MAPTKISFGKNATGNASFNNYRVSSPANVGVTTSTVNAVPSTIHVQDKVVNQPVVQTTEVHRVSQPQPAVVRSEIREQPVQRTSVVNAPPPVQQTVVHEQQIVNPPPRQVSTVVQEQPVGYVQHQYRESKLETAEDNFICSKCCWIIAAIVGLILLLLALLWGLGVFGGEGTASGVNVAAPSAAVAVPTAAVNTPTVTTPTVTTPTVTTPTVTTPTVTTPTVVAPTYTAPTVTTPSVSAPTVVTPTAVAPTAVAPTVVTPTVTTPTVTTPTVTTPVASVQPAAVQPQAVAPTAVSGNLAT